MERLKRAAKEAQVMARMLPETYEALQRIALELDRSVSWILNDLAVKFIAERSQHKGKGKQ